MRQANRRPRLDCLQKFRQGFASSELFQSDRRSKSIPCLGPRCHQLVEVLSTKCEHCEIRGCGPVGCQKIVNTSLTHAINWYSSGLVGRFLTRGQRETMDKVLAIEDDPAVQRALRRTFETAGFDITIASDGSSAMDVFRSTSPRVVILDLRLPGRSGQDICREIKRQSPTVPILVLSAASDIVDKVLLLELGADDYVTKPFSPRELLARVRAAV